MFPDNSPSYRSRASESFLTVQTVLTALGAFLGFGASVFFALGSIRLDATQIHQLSSPRWDFHPGVAKHLAEQRADYLCGAALLIVSFVAQAASIAPFPINAKTAFADAELGYIVVALIAATTWAVGRIAGRWSSRRTSAEVEALAQVQEANSNAQ